ncbi:hypothetical protein ACIRRA_45345 [Nocardia sp. NPDC101769]|uniref:hypothetical protein n=1 Tax=Nocardia sp. NPDC101769 TaxID=3364333 RepID=UPI00382821BE
MLVDLGGASIDAPHVALNVSVLQRFTLRLRRAGQGFVRIGRAPIDSNDVSLWGL